MGIFRNLLLRDERAIAKVALDAHVNDAGLFFNFNSACEFFAKLGMTPDQARDAASKCGLQDGVLCTKAQEEIPEAAKPQFQQPGKPGVMPNASLGMAGTPQPTQTNADGATEKPPVEPVKQPAPSTPAVTPQQTQEPAAAPAAKPEPKPEPLPPEQKARLEAAQDMLGIDDPAEAHPEKPAKPVQAQPAATPQPAQVQQAAPVAAAAPAPAQPAEVVKAMSVLCKDVFEGDNRGITDFENREQCLAESIQDGMNFDEAQDRCNELAASADWDDDLYKSIDPVMGAVLISDVLNKARETGGEILRVPLAVIAKICPSCGDKMAKSNLKVLKLRLTPADAELRKVIMEVSKSGTSEGVKLSWETRRGNAVAESKKANAASAKAKDTGKDSDHQAAAEAQDKAKLAWVATDPIWNPGQGNPSGEAWQQAHNEAKQKAFDHGENASDHRQELEGRNYDRQDKAKVERDEAMPLDRAKEIADTTLQQLGGNKFVVMTGAKHLARDGDGALSFQLPGGGFAKGGINHIKVALTPGDTYSVTYGKIRGNTYKVVHQADGLHADQLRNNFREHTGLETSLGGMGDVEKVDQRPTEAERNEVISEKWSSDIMDTSALANTPDNVTFTKPENVGIGKAQDIISEFVAKSGTSEGARKGAETKRAGGGSFFPDGDRSQFQTKLASGVVYDPDEHQNIQADYNANHKVNANSSDPEKKAAHDAAYENLRGQFGLQQQAPAETAGFKTPKDWIAAGGSRIGKALGLASAVVMVVKGFADRKCEDCGSKMYKNPPDGEYECPECDAEDLEKASPEAKYTTGGAFNGEGAGKELNCVEYLKAKGYGEASARRICSSIAQHVGG